MKNFVIALNTLNLRYKLTKTNEYLYLKKEKIRKNKKDKKEK